MSKVITVFGATGRQGGSVVRSVLSDPILSKEFKIRAVTRDASKPAAKELAAKEVDVVVADMSILGSVQSVVQGAHTVFLVTNFWEMRSAEVEITQGKNVADACKAAGVQHLIWSSLLNVTEISGGTLTHVLHFDSKATVESYIREIGVPATFVLPGTFMYGLYEMVEKQDDGSYSFNLPVGDDARFPLVDVELDTGKFVAAVIKHRDSLLGERIYACADYYSPSRISREFTEVTGKPMKITPISPEGYKSILPPAIAEEIYENIRLLVKPGYYNGADLTNSHNLLGDKKPSTWKEFLSRVHQPIRLD